MGRTRARECGTKKKLTEQEANNTLRWWREVRFANMTKYKCGYCGHWHIGGRPRKPRRR